MAKGAGSEIAVFILRKLNFHILLRDVVHFNYLIIAKIPFSIRIIIN